MRNHSVFSEVEIVHWSWTAHLKGRMKESFPNQRQDNERRGTM
jgi:hypothetical protein